MLNKIYTLILTGLISCIFIGNVSATNEKAIPFSSNLRVSLLTQDEGDEMYAYFGHTAIRVTDDSLEIDLVFNYGTFDFSTQNFYIRFIKGDLDYCLSIDEYDSFVHFSDKTKRTIHEQVLNMSFEEKCNVVNLLTDCYNSPARYYRYDFLRNNCSTKIRDIIEQATNGRIDFSKFDLNGSSFRQLLKPYVARNYWINFGINFLMGMETDKEAQPTDYMFLPVYIYKYLENTGNAEKAVIILDASPDKNNVFDFSYLIPWLIVLLMVGLSLWKKTRKISLYFISVIFSLFGLLVLTLGIYSLHPALGHNMNMIWTIPALLILIVRKGKVANFIRYAYISILLLIFINWFWLPQEMSATFIPWMLLMLFMLILDLNILEKFKNFRKRKLAQE